MFENGAPDRDPEEADGPQDGAQEQSREDLPAHHQEPVAELHLAQRQGADDQGRGLRARVASAGDDERHEEGQDDGPGDLVPRSSPSPSR